MSSGHPHLLTTCVIDAALEGRRVFSEWDMGRGPQAHVDKLLPAAQVCCLCLGGERKRTTAEAGGAGSVGPRQGACRLLRRVRVQKPEPVGLVLRSRTCYLLARTASSLTRYARKA